jgi:hypothetical protein
MRAIPFRNSSLTKLLEEVLTPREKKAKTVNSLQYGSMFSIMTKRKKTIRRTLEETESVLGVLHAPENQL